MKTNREVSLSAQLACEAAMISEVDEEDEVGVDKFVHSFGLQTARD